MGTVGFVLRSCGPGIAGRPRIKGSHLQKNRRKTPPSFFGRIYYTDTQPEPLYSRPQCFVILISGFDQKETELATATSREFCRVEEAPCFQIPHFLQTSNSTRQKHVHGGNMWRCDPYHQHRVSCSLCSNLFSPVPRLQEATSYSHTEALCYMLP